MPNETLALPTTGSIISVPDVALPDQAAAKNWLDFQHPCYERDNAKWTYAWEHYTGEVLNSQRIRNYLIRRNVGESGDSYNERLRLVDFTNHLATVVDSLVGILVGKEADAARRFAKDGEDAKDGSGLGTPADSDSPIGRLWRDADGSGTAWLTLFKQLAGMLCLTHKAWGIVTAPDGNPIVRFLPPGCVDNWFYDPEDGGLSEVKVYEQVDTRRSIQDSPKLVDTYIVYSRGGWQRWRTNKDGEPEMMNGPQDSGTYTFEDRRGRPCLPIFEIELPLRRPVGYLLARKQNTIFNLESGRDFLLWIANFPKLFVSAGNDLFQKIRAALQEGHNVLQEDPASARGHHYDAPPTTSAAIANDVLERKVEEFYITAFREYGDAARERTATEIKQDVAAGVGAFLQMLKAALDDAENNVYHRVEQILWPNNPDRWFVASVERSEDFTLSDINLLVGRMRERYFPAGESVPVGRTAQIGIAKQIADFEGLDVKDEEVELAVDIANIKALAQILPEFKLPPLAQARLALRVLEATGIVNPDENIEGADGERSSLRDTLLQQLEDAAEQADELQRNAAAFATQHPGALGGAPPGSTSPSGEEDVTFEEE